MFILNKKTKTLLPELPVYRTLADHHPEWIFGIDDATGKKMMADKSFIDRWLKFGIEGEVPAATGIISPSGVTVAAPEVAPPEPPVVAMPESIVVEPEPRVVELPEPAYDPTAMCPPAGRSEDGPPPAAAPTAAEALAAKRAKKQTVRGV